MVVWFLHDSAVLYCSPVSVVSSPSSLMLSSGCSKGWLNVWSLHDSAVLYCLSVSMVSSPSCLMLSSGCSKGWLNVWSLHDSAVLYSLTDVGVVQSLSWFAEHGLAVNFSRSKDITVLHSTTDWYHKNKVKSS